MTIANQPKFSVSEEITSSNERIADVFKKQKQFFETGETKSLDFRLQQVRKLKEAVITYESRIEEALYKDLHRSPQMTYYAEVGMSLKNITQTLRNLRKWAKSKRIAASHEMYPLSKCRVQYEPFGVVLLISPWNYPVLLNIGSLVAALSAGNCAILKPSEISLNTSLVIGKMMREYFDEEYVAVLQGGPDVAEELLKYSFDYIMFTGGTKIGKIVMEAAARNLTPITLEMGGKSPCIVDEKIDMTKSAKRIVFGKFLNCGHTCIAPDYLFIHEKIHDRFIEEIKKWIVEFFGENPQQSPDYGRIINQKHFDRIAKYMKDGKVIFGGETDDENLFIAPTLLTDVNPDSDVIQEEIFGPILPIFSYGDIEDVLKFIRERPKPLALYLFSNSSSLQEKIITETSSGGVAINDTITQFVSMNLPFGGVGASGMGRYHGKYGFETFSHHKGIMKQTNLIDLKMKYPPVTDKSIKLLKWVLK